jgi:hypothetical protein
MASVLAIGRCGGRRADWTPRSGDRTNSQFPAEAARQQTDDKWGSAQKKQKQMENGSRTGTPFCLVSLDDTFTGPEAETRNARWRATQRRIDLKRDRGGRREMRNKGDEGKNGMPKEAKKEKMRKMSRETRQ